jgi:hypothetical protein
MKKGLIILACLLILLGMFSCASTVNGVRIPDRAASKVDAQTHFYMVVSFWFAYGVTYHFFNKNQ